MSQRKIAPVLRDHVADLLDWVGPNAPTLCEGWDARDLAAHLVVRDRRPDALPGIGLQRFAAHTKKVQDRQAERPFPETVDLVRSGPPVYNLMRVPAIDERANLAEYAIHAEDVRRAQADPSSLPPMPDRAAVDDAVAALLPTMARLLLRKSPVGVVVRWAGRDDVVLKRVTNQGSVVLEALPLEVLLLLSGRGDHATVAVQGTPEATAAFRQFAATSLGL